MAITSFVPEIWSATLLSSLKASLVFGGPGVANRNYEGNINPGATVKINAVAAPSIATYTANSTTISPAVLATTSQSLVIDQSKYFAFAIDDIDYRQAQDGGALMVEAANESAYALADVADAYLAAQAYAGTDAGNITAATAVTTSALAVSALIVMMTQLNDNNVPSQGRYVIVPPWFYALLVTSDSFVDVSKSGSDESLRNGQVGRAFGFDVLVSSNTVSADSATDNVLQAGYSGAFTYAESIMEVEAYRPESAFSDALKGLHVYGAVATRGTALAAYVASSNAI